MKNFILMHIVVGYSVLKFLTNFDFSSSKAWPPAERGLALTSLTELNLKYFLLLRNRLVGEMSILEYV